MRKKSHIWLGKYVMDCSGSERLDRHSLAFLLGNILPDLRPSFLYRKHEYYGTLGTFQEKLEDLTHGMGLTKSDRRIYWVHMGEALHYLADYFTYPHNRNFPGGFTAHNLYEQRLKLYFKDYVKSGRALRDCEKPLSFRNVEEILAYVQEMHAAYMEQQEFSVESDTFYITRVCYQVLQGIYGIFQRNQNMQMYLKAV